MSDPVLVGGAIADPPLGGSLADPVLGGDLGAAQGAAGPPGPKGDTGPSGPAGGNRTYAFAFEPAAAVWSIVHGLGRFPSVTTLDTAGDVFVGDVSYPDANTVVVALSVPVAGTAYLN